MKRGDVTRGEVIKATLRVLAREGPRGVTHRAVAAEAGTSLRGPTYHFASREELLRAAFAAYAHEAVLRFDALAAMAPAPHVLGAEAAADLLTAIVASDLQEDRIGLLAEFELVLDIARGSDLAPAYHAWQDRLESMLMIYARELGSPSPVAHAKLVLATLRGLEMEALSRPGTVDLGHIRSVFLTLLQSIEGSHRRVGRSGDSQIAAE